MTWRWPWSHGNGRAREIERAREDATIERAAAERRLNEARLRARAADRSLDRFATWITDALEGR